jgi:hypothetical protein
MFGLDARIAVAVFAALSIAVGYTAFSKITSSRDAALYKELQEIDYALRQYASDMGTFPLFTINGATITPTVTADGARAFNALWTTNTNVAAAFVNKWNGPYLNIDTNVHRIYGTFTVSFGQANRAACTSTSVCYAWINLTNVPAETWTALNRYVDERGGATPEGTPITTGVVQANAATNPRTLHYRSSVVRNP